MNENGYSLSDIVTATGRIGDGAFGGDWGAWIILFLLFGLFGRGGYGGFGGGFGNGGDGGGNCCCTRGAISEGFAMNNLRAESMQYSRESVTVLMH